MNPYLLRALSFGPDIFDRLFRLIPASALDRATGPGRFSPREAIAHLADWEPIFLGRMVSAVEEPGIEIAVYDEGKMAELNGYSKLDIGDSLTRFAEARKNTVTFVEALSQDQMGIGFIHPEIGEMTLRDQANMLVCHDTYHVEQLLTVVSPKTAGTW